MTETANRRSLIQEGLRVKDVLEKAFGDEIYTKPITPRDLYVSRKIKNVNSITTANDLLKHLAKLGVAVFISGTDTEGYIFCRNANEIRDLLKGRVSEYEKTMSMYGIAVADAELSIDAATSLIPGEDIVAQETSSDHTNVEPLTPKENATQVSPV